MHWTALRFGRAHPSHCDDAAARVTVAGHPEDYTTADLLRQESEKSIRDEVIYNCYHFDSVWRSQRTSPTELKESACRVRRGLYRSQT